MEQVSKENTANTLKTVAAGASAGAAFGPIGAGIGGLVGGAIGLFGGAARKRDALRLIEQARILTDLNNNYFMGVGQSGYLASQYNLDHNYTQNGQLYGAKDGKLPGYKLGKPDAMLSNGEVMGHINPSTGQILDAEKVGRGVDFDDTIPKHLGKDTETRSSFVLPQKISPLTGVSPAEYAIETGDVKGGLLMYKDMKEYLRYKQLWNGRIPELLIGGYKCGKLPKHAGGKLDWMTAPDGPKPGELGDETKISLTPQHPNEYETYKRLIGATDLLENREFPKYVPYEDTTGSKRLSTLVPGLLGALGVATAYQMKPDKHLLAQDTGEKYDGQLILGALANLRPNSYAQYSAMRDAMRMGLYNLKQLGTSGGRYMNAAAAHNIGLQRNWANALAADNDRRNALVGNWASMAQKIKADNASIGTSSNQFKSNQLARSGSMYNTLYNNMLSQVLGQIQWSYGQGYNANTHNNMFALYDQDYALKRDELNRRVWS